jgi:hypothetical protein
MADAIGFLGGLPGWWLLPILILIAVGGVNEFLSSMRRGTSNSKEESFA